MGSAREATVRIGGQRYVIVSDDDYLKHARGVFGRGFEPGTVKLFTALARESEIVLDVGANIGCTALLFGGLARSVHAFEPSPTTFAFLEKNILRSGLRNLVLHNFGLGAETGEGTLNFSPANRSGGFVANHAQASADHMAEKIVIRRMDDVVGSLGLPRVDFIKIDVEGFEGQVLRGAARTLAAGRPVVALELNHWCLNAFQRTSIPDFFDYLRSVFPILLAIDGGRYRDLHDPDESYTVMYQHILHMRFPDILAAFDESRLGRFRSLYRRE